MKTLCICGTRPQLLKVSRKWANKIVNTGQHYDEKMNDIHAPRVDYNLGTTEVPEMMAGAIEIINKEKPDYVIVIGDTNSTLAGAYAANSCGVKLIHIEAGMRSGDDIREERIRIAVDKLADYYFCTTNHFIQNLNAEGYYDNISVVGDPSFDTLTATTPHCEERTHQDDPITYKPKWANKEKIPYSLLTLHRNELVNDEKNFKKVITALKRSEVNFIWPAHPNAVNKLKEFGIDVPTNIEIREPASHDELIRLMLHAEKVVTDSGGVQREAYWLAKPLVLVRDRTEHQEILDQGCGVLTGYHINKIISAVKTYKLTGIQKLPMGNTHERIKQEIDNL